MANKSSISNIHEMSFEASDFLEFDDWIEEDPGFPESTTTSEIVGGISSLNDQTINMLSGDKGSGSSEKKEIKEKVAFKTKSEVEVLNDGFKWRKYGKKMVKNSPYPRNYYRCSAEGCPVKKRVERDKDDPCYVLTTYEGIHNHQGPRT